MPTLLGAIKFVELLDGLGVDRDAATNRAEPSHVVAWQPAGGRCGAAIWVANVDFVFPAGQARRDRGECRRAIYHAASRWFGYGPPLRRLVADFDSLSAAPFSATLPISVQRPRQRWKTVWQISEPISSDQELSQ